MGKLNVDLLCQSAEACIGWPYVSPGTNDQNGIDCSGLFVKCFRDQGASIYHGSNTIYRKYCSEKGRLTNAGQLRRGYAVFKWNGNTPEKFNDGLGDFQHIGLVVSVNPLRIIHASSAGSVRVDSSISKWQYWGRLKDVDYDGESGTSGQSEQGDEMGETDSRFGVVTVGAGKTVKLRSSASQKSAMYWDIPHGNKIEVTGEKDGWYHGTAYDNTGKIRTGWMMSQFVRFDDETGGGTDNGQTVSIVLQMPESVAVSLLNQIAAQVAKG